MRNYAPINDDKDVVTKEYVDPIKSQAAINKTTLGTQCKNLFNPNAVSWYQPTKTSIAKDGTITSTTTSDSRTWGLANAEYFLTLPAGKYIVKTITESLDDTISANENIRGYNGTGSQVFEVYPNIVGTRTTTFTIDTVTTIGIMFKLFTQTCKIMIYDADITDDAYEPYQPSVKEQIIGAYFPMTIQKGIGNNTDLNTITEVGNYICWSGSSASTMSNCPTTSGAFRLIVTNRFQDCNESDNLRYQWIIPNNQDFVLYYRRSFNTSTNSFGSWYSFGGTAYSISVSGKSTSAAISYNGVPTLICLTPNTADSTAGGLYMINSAGAVVKLIEKTGVVVAAASSSKTFTITNNTSTVMDVCISRCWGR